jgi:hypothetical protein
VIYILKKHYIIFLKNIKTSLKDFQDEKDIYYSYPEHSNNWLPGEVKPPKQG